MAPRLQLHELLIELVENVYFQPPNNLDLEFPCILYERSGSDTQFAGNTKYRYTKRYQVTVIDRNPDSELSDSVEELPLCEFDRFFTADNLNHWVFTLFY